MGCGVAAEPVTAPQRRLLQQLRQPTDTGMPPDPVEPPDRPVAADPQVPATDQTMLLQQESLDQTSRRGTAAGITSVGVAVGAVAFSNPTWIGLVLAMLATSLLVMTAMILFGRRDQPLRRLLTVINELRRR
jgi:hypothetical protein